MLSIDRVTKCEIMPEKRSIIRHIPNIATSLNLVSGFISILLCMEGNLALAAWFIFLATVFDISDGLLARLLKAHSDLGKQLDSLADMISFGVAPALLFYSALRIFFEMKYQVFTYETLLVHEKLVLFSPVFLAITAALRLGKFNIDQRQEYSFIGLPSPATGIFTASYMLILLDNKNNVLGNYLFHPAFLLFLILLFSSLMISGIPMFSFKFRHYRWKENRLRYVFLGISVILVIAFKVYAIPAIILGYIIVSAGSHLVKNII